MFASKTVILILCLINQINVRARSAISIPKLTSAELPIDTLINLSEDRQRSTLNETDPEITPGLFEGDMAIDKKTFNHWRVGIRFDVYPEKMWPNRTVPYAISPLYEPDDQITIYKAIRTINLMTCIRFVPWNGIDPDFLLIWPIKYPRGCWSFVGRIGGSQILSLQPPDRNGPNCLGSEGRALHELMHALGLFHEQSRGDRDHFVKVHWKNIIPGYKTNFDKQPLNETTYSFEYDYDSVMHYGKYYFSKNRKPTLTSKMPGMKLGQRQALSVTDCLKISDLYGCLNDPILSKKYYTRCRVLGL